MLRIFALIFCFLFFTPALPQNGNSLWTGICVGTFISCGLCSLLELHNLYSLSQNKIPNALWEDFEERYAKYAAKNIEKFITAVGNIKNFVQKYPNSQEALNNWLDAIQQGTTITNFNFEKFRMWSKKKIDLMLITTFRTIKEKENVIEFPYVNISASTTANEGNMIKNNLRNFMYHYPPTQTYSQSHYLIKQFKKQYAYKKTAISLAILSFGSILSVGMIYTGYCN